MFVNLIHLMANSSQFSPLNTFSYQPRNPRKQQNSSRDDRICELCFHNKIGDEYHYLLECSYFSDARRVYLPRNLLARRNTDTYRRLMCSSDTKELFKITKYCKIVL